MSVSRLDWTQEQKNSLRDFLRVFNALKALDPDLKSNLQQAIVLVRVALN